MPETVAVLPIVRAPAVRVHGESENRTNPPGPTVLVGLILFPRLRRLPVMDDTQLDSQLRSSQCPLAAVRLAHERD